jgi:ketosteroid isomerase-like protein
VADEVEKLREMYEKWARGDYTVAGLFNPEMTMETFGMGEPMKTKGYGAFVDAMREWLRAWERPITIEAEEFIPSGDRVLVMITWKGRGRESGAEIEAEGAHLWTFRDGLVADCGVYRDRDEARAALRPGRASAG